MIVAHVYAAGEAPIAGADRDALVQGLRARGHRQVIPLDGPQDLARMVARLAQPGDIVVCLGAGNITQWAYALPGELAALGGRERGMTHARPRRRRARSSIRRMTFPDLSPSSKRACRTLRGRLMPNQPLAELTWFRVGGPAQVLFMPEDEADLAYFLARSAGRDSGHRHRARLQPDRARRRRAGRRDPARPRLRRDQGRGRRTASAPAPPCPT